MTERRARRERLDLIALTSVLSVAVVVVLALVAGAAAGVGPWAGARSRSRVPVVLSSVAASSATPVAPGPGSSSPGSLTVECVRSAPRVCFTAEHRVRAIALLPVLDRLYTVARERGYGELVPIVVTERAAASAPAAGVGLGRGRRQMFVLYDSWPDQRMVEVLTRTLVQPDCPPSSPYFRGQDGYTQRAVAVAATWQWLVGDDFPRGTLAGQSPLTAGQVHRVLEDFAGCSAPRLVGVTSRADVFASVAGGGGLTTAGVVVRSEASDPTVGSALRRAARRIRFIDQAGREYPDAAAFAAAHAVDDSLTVPARVSGIHLTRAGPAFSVTWGGGGTGFPFAVSAIQVVTEELRRSGVLDARLDGLAAAAPADLSGRPDLPL